jgi:hypothetical protein
MKSESEADGKVTFVFVSSAMPAGKQLFIGYLRPAVGGSRSTAAGVRLDARPAWVWPPGSVAVR